MYRKEPKFEKMWELLVCIKNVERKSCYGEEYENRKASLDDSFEFIDAPITYQSYYDGPIYYLIPATEVKRNGFYYRIAGNTCKNFIMVGYSDEQKEISYWFFSDFDLDFIAKEGEDFPDNMDWFLDTYYSLP